ncbi:hypothetical protein H310_05704 [Aphanomyces invadans]|uniref:GRIP domain-containing protein n=1 Tax=Aphanomyces invadans TaxID=157072 RepID=A0A024U6P3_9STRA|nr:hypothetical protein H310_05704 [Aphanomyces invadans]ETW02101.1 hypothetical protein H310_05704 [Aphanomyces invadans]|eukprot:XP_008868706.1 hypothetical protein H310_05704 [Aphanomyces invadans]
MADDDGVMMPAAESGLATASTTPSAEVVDAPQGSTDGLLQTAAQNAVDEAAKWKERSARLGSAVNQQKARIQELEESDTRLKRLLNLAKRSIESKDASIESLKQQVVELKAAAAKQGRAKDPRRILHKVKHVSHAGLTTLWCLVEYTSDDDDDSRPPESGWLSFQSEDDLVEYVRRAAGEPLRVPDLSLPPSDIHQMTQDLSDELERVQEEFRRYRVRSEITRKQKEAELRKISATALTKQTEHIGGVDLQQELQAARLQVRRFSQLQTAAEERERELQDKYDKLTRDYAKLSGTMGETVLAMEWRSRYEQVVAEKAALEEQVVASSTSAAHGHHLLDVEIGGNDITKLKMEFALYRKRAMQVVDQKEKELQQYTSRTHSGGSTGALSGFSSAGLRRMSSSNSLNGFETSSHAPTTNEYLKNIVIKYMSTDQEEVKEHMEKAIATVLNFSPTEVKKIQDKRKGGAAGWGLW